VQCETKGFARGDRTGVLSTRVPFPAKTPSNAVVNLPSRSRIRNLNLLARSPCEPVTRLSCGEGPVSGLRCWRAERGLAVVPGVVLSLILARRVVVISEHRRRGWRWPSLLCRTC